jgi:predicted TIM-barrel fold metal-dependent hydrolase
VRAERIVQTFGDNVLRIAEVDRRRSRAASRLLHNSGKVRVAAHDGYRRAEGRSERYTEIAAEFARLKVDVIFTSGTATVVAAKQATTVIPIIFAAAGDPAERQRSATAARFTNEALEFYSNLAGPRSEHFDPSVTSLTNGAQFPASCFPQASPRPDEDLG